MSDPSVHPFQPKIDYHQHAALHNLRSCSSSRFPKASYPPSCSKPISHLVHSSTPQQAVWSCHTKSPAPQPIQSRPSPNTSKVFHPTIPPEAIVLSSCTNSFVLPIHWKPPTPSCCTYSICPSTPDTFWMRSSSHSKWKWPHSASCP